jgi:hypothetical protein
MAYSFVRTSSQNLSTSSTPVTTYPATIAALCRTSNTTNNQTLASINRGNTENFFINIEGAVNDKFGVFVNTGATGVNSTSTYPVGNYFSGVGVFSSSTSRTAYLDGGSSATDATSALTTSLVAIRIGALTINNSIFDYMDGQLAEIAIWNVALTDAEAVSLAKGFKPTRIRPQSLVFYAPLIRTLQDTRGGRVITNNNSATVAAHPRVY